MKKPKNYIKSLNPLKFVSIMQERVKRFKKGAETPLPRRYPVNELARKLHPKKQYVKIAAITERAPDCKTFTFVADKERGTQELAYFASGRYVTVFLNIEGLKITRAYSLCSSPKESLTTGDRDGFYQITVKAVGGGLVSNYILENWEVGTKVELSAPEGQFDYVYLRDAPTVVCLAGGSGITPFLSMAKSICDGDEDFNMILLYGSRDKKSILFKEEFDQLQKKNHRIRVVHVLSDEKAPKLDAGTAEGTDTSKMPAGTGESADSSKMDVHTGAGVETGAGAVPSSENAASFGSASLESTADFGENAARFEYGFITADLIKKYAPNSDFSVFLCGPQAMYNFLDKELQKLNLPKKYIRHEMFGEIHSAKTQEDYPGFEGNADENPAEANATATSEPNPSAKNENQSSQVAITITICDQTKTVYGNPDDTILQILEKNGIAVPSRCRSGECGWCHSYLKSGKVFVPKKMDFRRKADLKYGFIHPCCTFALTNLEIDVPPQI